MWVHVNINDYLSNQLQSITNKFKILNKFKLICNFLVPIIYAPNTCTPHRGFYLTTFDLNPSKMPKILHRMRIHGYFLELRNKKILIAQKTWLEGLANLPLTLFCHIMWIAHLYWYMGRMRRHQKTINLPFLTTVFPFWTDTAAKRRCQRTWRGEWQSVAWWHMHHTEPAFYSELRHCAAATF